MNFVIILIVIAILCTFMENYFLKKHVKILKERVKDLEFHIYPKREERK